MPCDHKLITEHAYDYVEGSLSSYIRAQCDEALQHCLHCQETLQKTEEIHRLAQSWKNQAVPSWSRGKQLIRPPVSQLSWPNWAALTCSLLAVFLLVFQLEVSIDDGLHISFGGSQREARLQALLAEQLEQYGAQQNLNLETRLDEYMEFQDLNNRVVLNEWLEQNREEREDDMNFLMSGWQSQRLQDSQRVNQQLDILTENQIDNNSYLNELIRNVSFPRGENL